MQIDFTSLTKNWTAFSDIVTVENDVTYRIQNRGSYSFIALEANSTPGDTEAGTSVLPSETLSYKKGSQNLYLRSLNKFCPINITQGE